MKKILTACGLVIVVMATIIVPRVSGRQAVSAGGVFLPLQDYVLAGQWTYTNATPLILQGLTGVLYGNGTSAVTAVSTTGTSTFVRSVSPVLTGTPAIAAATGTSLAVTGALSSSSPSAGVGYATGAGCAVTQATNKSTTVVCTGVSGAVTMNNANLATTAAVGFTVTDTSVTATDAIFLSIKSGATANSYTVTVDAVAAGSFHICLRNFTGGDLAEAVVINFAVIKGVAS